LSISAIVLDLDGTLVDSRQDIAVSLLAAVAGLGHQSRLDATALGAMVGRPLADMLQAAVPGLDSDGVQHGADLYRAHYLEHCLDHTTLFAGVEQAVRALVGRTTLGCATTKRTNQAARILAGLDLLDAMDLCLGTSPDMRYKPAPDLLLAAAEALSIDPARMVYVGDTELDLRAAHAAGSQAAWVRWGYGDEARCLAAKPHHIVDTPEALARLSHQTS
jgi:phosphoglycolate phosphatase